MRRINREALDRGKGDVGPQYVRFKTVLGPYSMADVNAFDRKDPLEVDVVPVYTGCFAATACGHFYPEIEFIQVRSTHVEFHQQRARQKMFERWHEIAPYLKSPALTDPNRLQAPTLVGTRDDEPPHVYFLLDSTDPLRSRVKVGASADIQRRIGELIRDYNCDSAKVELIGVVPYGDYALEKRIHALLQNYLEPDCKGGHEWFAYTPYVKAVIQNYLIA